MGTRTLRATLLASLLLGASALPAAAQAQSEAGWQVGSAVATLLYAPAKVAYAATGLVFGGVSWALSGGNEEVARAVIAPAVQGDYLVTPEHLRRERPLHFVGTSAWSTAAEAQPLDTEPAYADAPYEEPFADFESPYRGDPEPRYRQSPEPLY